MSVQYKWPRPEFDVIFCWLDWRNGVNIGASSIVKPYPPMEIIFNCPNCDQELAVDERRRRLGNPVSDVQ